MAKVKNGAYVVPDVWENDPEVQRRIKQQEQVETPKKKKQSGCVTTLFVMFFVVLFIIIFENVVVKKMHENNSATIQRVSVSTMTEEEKKPYTMYYVEYRKGIVSGTTDLQELDDGFTTALKLKNKTNAQQFADAILEKATVCEFKYGFNTTLADKMPIEYVEAYNSLVNYTNSICQNYSILAGIQTDYLDGSKTFDKVTTQRKHISEMMLELTSKIGSANDAFGVSK